LEAFDPLLTIAEIALALAGFTGIIVVFGRSPGHLFAGDAFRLYVLLGLSFSVLFLAFIPIALHLSGVRGEALPRLASGISILVGVLLGGSLVPRFRQARRESPEIFGPISYLFGGGSLVNLGAQAFNALSLSFESTLSIFFWGLLWTLLYGCVQFARLLFVRPKAG